MSRNSMVLFTAAVFVCSSIGVAAGPINALSQDRRLMGDSNANGAKDATQDIQEAGANDFARYEDALFTIADVGDAQAAVDSWQDSIIGSRALIATGGFHSESIVEEGATFAYGVGASIYTINFQLDEMTAYDISGVMAASEGIHARLTLTQNSQEIQNLLVTNDTQGVALSGELMAGQYALSVTAFGTSFVQQSAGDDHEAAHFSVQFRTAGEEEDITGDGIVNVSDLFQLLEGWGACPDADGYCLADINRDHQVNVSDLFQMLGAWSP